MTLVHLASTNAISENDIVSCTVENKRIILMKVDGRIVAYDGICPHQGADLSQGTIDQHHVICPMHGKHFSCATGKERMGSLSLTAYSIEIRNDEIYFDKVQLSGKDGNDISPTVRRIKDLPKPKGKFLVGNLLEFIEGNRHQVLEKWTASHGDLFRIRLLGKNFVVTSNENMNSQLLKERPGLFRRFSKIKVVMEEMGVEGVFSAEGEQWKHHRKMVAEALSVKNVKAYFYVLHQMTARLLTRWQHLSRNEKVVDIQKEMMLYTVDITTLIAFGYDTNTMQSDQDRIQDHLKNIFPMIEKRMAAPIPFHRLWKTKQDKELDHSLLEIRKTIDEIILSTRKRFQENPKLKDHPKNLLETLLVEQEKDSSFSDKEVFGNVFTMLLAGEDTTSNSISWAMYYLSQNPEVMTKLRSEADAVLGQHEVVSSIDQLDQLKYTEAVALESLRINPATPVLILQANEDTVVQGLEIPTGTPIILLSRVRQRDNKYFSEPDQFRPERWLAGCPVHNPDVMLVFGAGPRYCPGRNLAIQEMKMALSMIARNFDVALDVEPQEVKEVLAFTLSPSNLNMRIKARTEEYDLIK